MKCTDSVHFTPQNGCVPQDRRDDPPQCILRKVIDFFTTEDVASDPRYVIRTLSEALDLVAS